MNSAEGTEDVDGEKSNPPTPKTIDKHDSFASALTDEDYPAEDQKNHHHHDEKGHRKRLHFPHILKHREAHDDGHEEHHRKGKFRWKHGPGLHFRSPKSSGETASDGEDQDHEHLATGAHSGEEGQSSFGDSEHTADSDHGRRRLKLHLPVRHRNHGGEKAHGHKERHLRNPFRKSRTSENATGGVLASPIAEHDREENVVGSDDGIANSDGDEEELTSEHESDGEEENSALGSAKAQSTHTVESRDSGESKDTKSASETKKSLQKLFRLPHQLHNDTADQSHNSEDASTPNHKAHMKEKVTEKIHKLRRRLNPRSNRAKWRFRLEEGKNNDDEYAEVWDWEDSDSEGGDQENTSHEKTPSGGKSVSDSFSTFDDFFGSTARSEVVSCGVSPSPIEGVSLRGSVFDTKREYRLKPHHCFREPTYMTEEELYRDMMKPSVSVELLDSFVQPAHESSMKVKPPTLTEMDFWGTPDDGRIGSLRVEVLSCVGLTKHKADAAVYLVCGDAAFATDVIHGSRSPMWPSCSRRAAVFPVHHAFVRLFVGVFDVSSNRAGENDEFCGRIVVDIPTLRPNSEYDVTLPLRASSSIYDRRAKGVVRIRLSLHWFTERGAILSYFRRPKNILNEEECTLPCIRCADPKTFRNVAVTVHGKDLPGKYTRRAMRATMREFNLYRLNLVFFVKSTIEDAILYEKPVMSLYLFAAWMHCVISCSMRFVPAYFVGFLIFLYLDSYREHVRSHARHHGYSPVTLQEILMALLTDSSSGSRHLTPLRVAKRAREGKEKSFTAKPLDHREFPFSERFEYRKRSIEDALVSRAAPQHKRMRKDDTRLKRLSIYVKDGKDGKKTFEDEAMEQMHMPEENTTPLGEEIQFDNQDNEEVDDLSFGDDLDTDLDEDEDDMVDDKIVEDEVYNEILRRLPLGPPQDSDVGPRKKIPPQVHFARVENKLNKLTRAITMDKVFFSTLSKRLTSSAADAPDADTESTRSQAESTLASALRQNRKNPLDEFDKRLGLRVRTTNPIAEITSSFLGPLMRIFRIICILVRIAFNVGTWNDPYLSFWALCGLVLLMFVLIIFPWRIFFFVVGAVALGPQNFVFRRQLHSLKTKLAARKAAANEKRNQSIVSLETQMTKSIDTLQSDDVATQASSTDEKNETRRRGPRKRLLGHLANRRQMRRERLNAAFETSNVRSESRTPFSAASHHQLLPNAVRLKKPVQPRDVVVPYTPFRLERFYDWPPDPTVSRVTPVILENCAFQAFPIGEEGSRAPKRKKP